MNISWKFTKLFAECAISSSSIVFLELFNSLNIASIVDSRCDQPFLTNSSLLSEFQIDMGNWIIVKACRTAVLMTTWKGIDCFQPISNEANLMRQQRSQIYVEERQWAAFAWPLS
jgi:hypothetical protein